MATLVSTISELTYAGPVQSTYNIAVDASTYTGYVTAADLKTFITSGSLGAITGTSGSFGTLSSTSLSTGPITGTSIGGTSLAISGSGSIASLSVTGALTSGSSAIASSAWNKLDLSTTGATPVARLGVDSTGSIFVTTNALYNLVSSNWSADTTSKKAFAYEQNETTGRHEFKTASLSALSPYITWATPVTIDETGLQAINIGGITPGTGVFSTLTATTTQAGALSAASLNNTPIGNYPGGASSAIFTSVTAGSLTVASLNGTVIGNTTATTGAFTALSASGVLTVTNTSSGALVVSGGASISGSLSAGALYDNGSRVVTSVTHTAGTGVSISQTTTGPSAGATISIGQNVATSASPTFNNITSTGQFLPSSSSNSGGGAWYFGSAWGGQGFAATGTNSATGIQYSGGSGSQLFTFSSGPGQLSIQTDGSIFIGDGQSYNPIGMNGSSDGYLSVQNSAQIGGSIYVAGTMYGTATSAKYADLAENYKADAEYVPGTVVVFGGNEEITTTTEMADVSVAGVISTNPAYLMNSELLDSLPVALRGRVPVRVVGPVYKGELLVTSSIAGCAMSVGKNKTYGISIFAKAIETNTSLDEKVIEAVIL